MEDIANHVAYTLVLLKEQILESLKPELQSVAKEVISSLKPQLQSIAKEVTSMKDTIQNLEEPMRKSRIPSIPRSISNDLDGFAIAPESSDSMKNIRFLGQQQCVQTLNPEPNVFNNAAKYSGNFCGASQQISFLCIQPAVSEEFYNGMTPVLNSQPAKKEVPPNLTLTSSDPLPNPNSVTWKVPQLPTLSVTIPPHHGKADVLGNQHLEWRGGISKTFNNIPTSVSTTTTSNVAVSVAPMEACNKYATFSVVPEVEALAAAAGFESFDDSTAESFGSGVNIFGMECDQHGEDEEVVFCQRAELFRQIDTEWKEREIGDIKILKNKEGTHRIFVKLDQIHKIYASYKMSPEMTLTIPQNETKGFIWTFNDFSNAELRLEKFFIRFKLPETAAAFQEAFSLAWESVESGKTVKIEENPLSFGKSTIRKFATSTPTNKNDNTIDGSSLLSGVLNVVGSTPADSPKFTTAPFSSLVNFKFDNSLTANTGVSIGCGSCTTSTTTLINCTTNVTGTISSLTSVSSVTNGNTSMNTISGCKNIRAANDSICNNLNKSTTAPFSIATAITTSVAPVMASKENATSNLNKSAASDAKNDYVSNTEFQPDSTKDNTVSPKSTVSNITAPISKIFNFGFPAAGAASTILTPSLPTQSTFTFQKPDAITKSTIAFSDKQPSTDLTCTEGFSDQFKPKAGSWVCPSCYISKPGDSLHCMAGDAPKKEANINVLCLSDSAQKFTFDYPVANTSKNEIITPKVDFGFNTASIPATGVFTFTTSSTTSTSLSAIPITTLAPNSATFIVESSDKLGVLNGLPLQSTDALTLSKMSTSQESISDAFSLNSQVFNFTLKPKSLEKSGEGPLKFGSVATGARDEDIESKHPDGEESSAPFTPIIPLPDESKKIDDKFMKAVKKASDGTASPIVETVGTTTFVSTSASLGPCAPNITEGTEELVNDLKLRLNCFEQPNSDCIASQGCDPEEFTYINARNHGTKLAYENLINCLAGNTFGVLTEMRNMGNVTNLTSATADKAQSTCRMSTQSPFGSAINYPKDSNAKNSTCDPSSSVADFPSNEITTTGGYVAAERKDFSFDQKPLIFGNSSSVVGETTVDKAQPASIFENNFKSLPEAPIFGPIPPKFGNSSSMSGEPSQSIFDSAINNSNGGSVNSSIYGSSFTSFTGLPLNENTIEDEYVYGLGEYPITTRTHVATSANTGPFRNLSKTTTVAEHFARLVAKARKDDKVMVALVAKGNEKPGPGNFIDLTDQNAFARFAKPLTGLNDEKNNETGDWSAAEKNFNVKNFDPHYEPVIALPEKVVITTGEEEETKLFGEPATLFRWDDTNKEWKERGVGEFKILFHPIKQTYRMLMRREKVYKLILNHAVNADFSFSEMKINPNSFLWAAMNYAERPEGVLEKLGVRFKNAILADLFREHVNKCIATNQNRDY